MIKLILSTKHKTATIQNLSGYGTPKWNKTDYKVQEIKKSMGPKVHKWCQTMVSQKNYNLNANEGFVIFFTFKLITCFIDGFTLKMNPNQLENNLSTLSEMIDYVLNGFKHIYIGFWTLKVKCTQCGICGWVAFKNARTMIFSKSGRASRSSWSGPSKKSRFLSRRAALAHIHLPWEARRGASVTSPIDCPWDSDWE